MRNDDARLEMVYGCLFEDHLAATEEEPMPCPIDPRGKKNVIKYKPPMIALTATQKKKGPKSTRS